MTLVMNIKTQKRKNKEIMFLVCDKLGLFRCDILYSPFWKLQIPGH